MRELFFATSLVTGSVVLGIALGALSSCGRAPSRLLRQGQLPVYDFPLYLSEGTTGTVWKYERDGSRTKLIDGLDDPRGVASDRFNHIYVAEYGAGRLLKVDVTTGVAEAVATDLEAPTVVAVNSVGEAFVAQDTPQNVVRARDKKVIASYTSRPSALAFGVDDIMVVGLFEDNQVHWGTTQVASVNEPVNVSIDGMGRVYVADGSTSDGRIVRFNQKEPGGSGSVLINKLNGPAGIAVDPVGNAYVVEQGSSRIVLATADGQLFVWASADLSDPQYLAFTQY